MKTFVWCGNEICEERDGNGTNVTKRFFAQGEQRLGGSDAGIYYYTRDHLGSVREVTRQSDGEVLGQYDYDPYGNRVVLRGKIDTDFGFTGHYYHAPSGFDLTLYRAYDPKLGRWINRDPIGEGAGPNLYRYVDNNPLRLFDPFGLYGYWTEEKAPDKYDHFGTGDLVKHKLAPTGNDPATLIWTKPCGDDKLVDMVVTKKPTLGTSAHIDGDDGVMWVETRYALFHSGTDGIGAAKAKFYCVKKCVVPVKEQIY